MMDQKQQMMGQMAAQQGMPSPWLGMQAQPDPMQMQALQEQMAMQQNPQMFAQAQQVSPGMHTAADSIRNAMKLQQTPVPPPAATPPAEPAYPGLGNIVTDRVKKIRSR